MFPSPDYEWQHVMLTVQEKFQLYTYLLKQKQFSRKTLTDAFPNLKPLEVSNFLSGLSPQGILTSYRKTAPLTTIYKLNKKDTELINAQLQQFSITTTRTVIRREVLPDGTTVEKEVRSDTVQTPPSSFTPEQNSSVANGVPSTRPPSLKRFSKRIAVPNFSSVTIKPNRILQFSLTVDAEDTLECIMTYKETGEKFEVGIETSSDNRKKRNISINPKKSGLHSFEMLLSGKPIEGSPFEFNVLPLTGYEACTFVNQNGDQVFKIVKGVLKFQVDVFKAGPGDLTASIKAPNDVLHNLEVDQQSDIASFQYKPKENGCHFLNVYFNDMVIPTSPREIVIQGITDKSKKQKLPNVLRNPSAPQKVHSVSIPDVTGVNIEVGQTIKLPFRVVNDDPSKLRIACLHEESQKVVDLELDKADGEGKRIITFTPNIHGVYLFSIFLGDQELPSSPIRLTVKESSYDTDFRFNPISEGSYFRFIKGQVEFEVLDATNCDDFDNLSAYFVSPSDTKVTLKPQIEKPLARYRFEATENGKHDINVLRKDKPLLGSPKELKISGIQKSLFAPGAPTLKCPPEVKGGRIVFTFLLQNPNDARQFVIVIKDDNDKDVPSNISLAERIFRVSFQPKNPGKYHVDCRFKGLPTPQSPIVLNVMFIGTVLQTCSFKSPSQVEFVKCEAAASTKLLLLKKKPEVSAGNIMLSFEPFDVLYYVICHGPSKEVIPLKTNKSESIISVSCAPRVSGKYIFSLFDKDDNQVGNTFIVNIKVIGRKISCIPETLISMSLFAWLKPPPEVAKRFVVLTFDVPPTPLHNHHDLYKATCKDPSHHILHNESTVSGRNLVIKFKPTVPGRYSVSLAHTSIPVPAFPLYLFITFAGPNIKCSVLEDEPLEALNVEEKLLKPIKSKPVKTKPVKAKQPEIVDEPAPIQTEKQQPLYSKPETKIERPNVDLGIQRKRRPDTNLLSMKAASISSSNGGKTCLLSFPNGKLFSITDNIVCVKIKLYDDYFSPIKILILSPDKDFIPAKITRSSPTTIAIFFPYGMPGYYTVNVTTNGDPLPGLPVTLNIPGPPSIKRFKRFSTDRKQPNPVITGLPQKIVIYIEQEIVLPIKMYDTTQTAFNCRTFNVTTADDNDYEILGGPGNIKMLTIKPNGIGIHRVHIYFHGDELAGSPIEFEVVPKPMDISSGSPILLPIVNFVDACDDTFSETSDLTSEISLYADEDPGSDDQSLPDTLCLHKHSQDLADINFKDVIHHPDKDYYKLPTKSIFRPIPFGTRLPFPLEEELQKKGDYREVMEPTFDVQDIEDSILSDIHPVDVEEIDDLQKARDVDELSLDVDDIPDDVDNEEDDRNSVLPCTPKSNDRVPVASPKPMDVEDMSLIADTDSDIPESCREVIQLKSESSDYKEPLLSDNDTAPIPSKSVLKRPPLFQDENKHPATPEADSQRKLPKRKKQSSKSHPRDEKPMSPRDKSERPMSPRDENKRPISPRDQHDRPLSPNGQYRRPISPKDRCGRPMPARDQYGRPMSPKDQYGRPMSPKDQFHRLLSPKHRKRRPISPTDQVRRPMSPRDKNKRPLSPKDPYERPTSRREDKRPLSPKGKPDRPLSPKDQYRRPTSPQSKYGRPTSPGDKNRRPLSPNNRSDRPKSPSDKNKRHPKRNKKDPKSPKKGEQYPEDDDSLGDIPGLTFQRIQPKEKGKTPKPLSFSVEPLTSPKQSRKFAPDDAPKPELLYHMVYPPTESDISKPKDFEELLPCTAPTPHEVEHLPLTSDDDNEDEGNDFMPSEPLEKGSSPTTSDSEDDLKVDKDEKQSVKRKAPKKSDEGVEDMLPESLPVTADAESIPSSSESNDDIQADKDEKEPVKRKAPKKPDGGVEGMLLESLPVTADAESIPSSSESGDDVQVDKDETEPVKRKAPKKPDEGFEDMLPESLPVTADAESIPSSSESDDDIKVDKDEKEPVKRKAPKKPDEGVEDMLPESLPVTVDARSIPTSSDSDNDLQVDKDEKEPVKRKAPKKPDDGVEDMLPESLPVTVNVESSSSSAESDDIEDDKDEKGPDERKAPKKPDEGVEDLLPESLPVIIDVESSPSSAESDDDNEDDKDEKGPVERKAPKKPDEGVENLLPESLPFAVDVESIPSSSGSDIQADKDEKERVERKAPKKPDEGVEDMLPESLPVTVDIESSPSESESDDENHADKDEKEPVERKATKKPDEGVEDMFPESLPITMGVESIPPSP